LDEMYLGQMPRHNSKLRTISLTPLGFEEIMMIINHVTEGMISDHVIGRPYLSDHVIGRPYLSEVRKAKMS